MERREKMEQVIREREKTRIDNTRKWARREESDFFRTIWNFGVQFDREKQCFDWTKFKTISKLDKKTDEALTEYYKRFINMCKRQSGQNIEEDVSELAVEVVDPEKARRILERVELLNKIREEVVTHPQLDEKLKLCQPSSDLPEWWIPGKHDKDLLVGVSKHGLGRSDFNILNDPELTFYEIVRKKCSTEELDSKQAIKLESPEDILKFDKNEILVKLEKGEGTLKIEKVNIKKESDAETKPVKPKIDKVNVICIKTEEKEESIEKVKKEEKKSTEEVELEKSTQPPDDEVEETNEELEKSKDDADKTVDEDETKKKDKSEDSAELAELDFPDRRTTRSKRRHMEKEIEEKVQKDKNEEKCEPKPKTELEKQKDDACKQAAELKAMFPDLEVIQPLSRLSQVDAFVIRDCKGASGALDFSETTVAQMFNSAVNWPKEYVIQVRLQQLVHLIENNEWPKAKSFAIYPLSDLDQDQNFETSSGTPKRETSTPMSLSENSEVITITTDHGKSHGGNGNKKQKRHIAIDVETERAKLHALLNNSSHTSQLPTPLLKPTTTWNDNEDSEESRHSTPVPQSNLQPPPAHQHTSRVLSMPFDLKYPLSTKMTPPPACTNTTTATSSSVLAPIDLSSGLPKMSTPDIPKVTIQQTSSSADNEIQDFSITAKKQTPSSPASSVSSASGGGKGKLDDMLSKLMKKKNVPEPEPVVGGKEKKRRKLDEIVLGLSAAKEQSLFPESKKVSSSITPSVTLTPTTVPQTTSAPSQKPFTVTVTSVPSPVPSTSRSSSLSSLVSPLPSSKDSFSNFLSPAEQNLLLKKQQQLFQQAAQAQLPPSQRKSYEQMIADINKVSDFSSKVSSYSHEAKVNKWLAEQNSVVPEQPLSADFLAPRRRRPRIDPSLLDWKKLTGEENVSVINRVTGKKLTGPKAPPLKRLGQWLIENPMYDIDPKWAELVKERGNLSHDLQKRVPGGSKKGPGRPPLLASPPGTSPINSANLATSMASSLQFPSLSTAGLSGLNSSLLSGLSLGQFDPKNNPLLMPFSGMPNMNALSSMSGLGNLGNMNLFANLASLGLPGLMGMDNAAAAAAALNATASGSGESSASSSTGANSGSKSKSRKPNESHSSSSAKTPVSSATGSIPTTSPFPFFFPNPSLLYTPLGLGGLNPFSMQPGMSSAFDTLAQQCGLLNGMGLSTTASTSQTTNSKPSSKSHSPRSSSTTLPSTSSNKSHVSSSQKSAWEQLDRAQQAQLQQLLLPHDTHLLESISRATNIESALKAQTSTEKRKDDKSAVDTIKSDKKKNSEIFANTSITAEYLSSDKFTKGNVLSGSSISLSKQKESNEPKNVIDLNKSSISISALESSTLKRNREQELKEALEHLSKTQAELIAKTSDTDEIRLTATSLANAMKRPFDLIASTEEPQETSDRAQDESQPPPKKIKEAVQEPEKSRTPVSSTPEPPIVTVIPPVPITTSCMDVSGEVDIEALLTPSTVVKGGGTAPPVDPDKSIVSATAPTCESTTSNDPLPESKPSNADVISLTVDADVNDSTGKKGRRTRATKRKSGDESETPVVERKNLRSSAGRAAAAAAARAAAEAAAAKQQEAENAKHESTTSKNS